MTVDDQKTVFSTRHRWASRSGWSRLSSLRARNRSPWPNLRRGCRMAPIPAEALVHLRQALRGAGGQSGAGRRCLCASAPRPTLGSSCAARRSRRASCRARRSKRWRSWPITSRSTRAEIEEIRGVAVSRGTVDQLMELEWIRLGRRRMTPGRPVTFVVTERLPGPFRAGIGARSAGAEGVARGRACWTTGPLPGQGLPGEDETPTTSSVVGQSELFED